MTAPARQRNAIETLRHHHPLVIEGMGGYDTRDPYWVASVIVDQLTARWSTDPLPKPVLLITQGDPYERQGIAAITRLVADALDVPRALVFLDPHIADYHAPNADRYKVTCEIAYSELVTTLQSDCPGALESMEKRIGKVLQEKNSRRKAAGKSVLREYYRDFALLQEVTKVACKKICGDVTVAHTSSTIDDYSVSSFYKVGLGLGLIDADDMVPFANT
jgi:hypothetical protein